MDLGLDLSETERLGLWQGLRQGGDILGNGGAKENCILGQMSF